MNTNTESPRQKVFVFDIENINTTSQAVSLFSNDPEANRSVYIKIPEQEDDAYMKFVETLLKSPIQDIIVLEFQHLYGHKNAINTVYKVVKGDKEFYSRIAVHPLQYQDNISRQYLSPANGNRGWNYF